MSICDNEDSPSRLKKLIYSRDEKPINHEHKSESISSNTNALHNSWLDFMKDVGSRVSAAKSWFGTYSTLLNLLERSTGLDTVTRGIEKLKAFEETITRYYESEVEPLINENDSLKLESTQATLDSFLQ